ASRRRTPMACAAPAASPSATAVTSDRRIRPCSAERWGAASSLRSDRWTPERGGIVIVFRALSALLSYPTAELRQALPEIAEAVTSSPLIAARECAGIVTLIDELSGRDLMGAEERYVELFDRGRATSLHLFEHLYGDSRDRGEAMVELKRIYERAGFALTTNELPDYLPVLLEYLSCRDLAEARDMLADCAHILKKIAEA